MSAIRSKAEAVKIIGKLVNKELQDNTKKTEETENIEHAWFIICRNMR
jgi:hypothetical protein